jgi:tricorn protease
MRRSPLLLPLVCLTLVAEAPRGYYRQPALHGTTLVFVAEGDLWTVPATGGTARRLTSHPGPETRPAISPDGKTLAFNATYEGPGEVYTMPLEGGLPTRRTFQGGGVTVAGWTPQGHLMVTSRNRATLPDAQLLDLDPASGAARPIPLAQAAEGAWNGGTLVFTRYSDQGSFTKRYKGGTAQNLWSFTAGEPEARPLTADFDGTSRNPMVWQGRVYFLSDRDGTMNLWSMDAAGHDLKQHTTHKGWDIRSASLSEGRVAYQLGADIRILDLATGRDEVVPILLATDFDQRRERWVHNPMDYLTQLHLSPEGDRVALTARGQVFVAPVETGRFVDVTRSAKGPRIREARFMPDGKNLLTLSDASGEVELWTLPANGVGQGRQLTKDATVLRWDAMPSPDGKRVAHTDKAQQLWVLDVATGAEKLVARSEDGTPEDLAWSPDGAWLAFVQNADNTFPVIKLFDVAKGATTTVTSDRFESFSPVWSPDGHWLYFLSGRHFQSTVPAPWGLRNPEPHFDRSTKVFALALQKGLRSPFLPLDELTSGEVKKEEAPKGKDKDKKETRPAVTVEVDGIQDRLEEVPVPPGNLRSLATDGKRLYWLAGDGGPEGKTSLQSLAIDNKPPFKPEVFLDDVRGFELTRKLVVRKGNDILVMDPGPKAPAELAKCVVNLHDWTFSLDPREEWREMFIDAWRMERDYFYDQGMLKVDWPAIRAKYLPLVDRVSDREELADIFGQMIGELSTLHMFVYGGDQRSGLDKVDPASLGADLEPAGEGWRVAWIHQGDPQLPETLSPLARPGVDVREGDLILAINGTPLKDVVHPSLLLRSQAGKQVLLRVRRGTTERDVVVQPIPSQADASLRYLEWELSRRREVEQKSAGKVGYVHLRAMGASDVGTWYQDFYPVAGRQGLVIDMRHNRGGNIDSWILEKLLRRAWFFWKPAVGKPFPNMPDSFRGHIAVLCDAWTASDGEAFTEGFRRLGLGRVFGTRTWGGEVWLSSGNVLRDKGIATAAEMGVFGPEGTWLIEGRGVEPDQVVDNLPHATFQGRDAQLEAALAWLDEQIRKDPRPVPQVPAYPDKSTY